MNIFFLLEDQQNKVQVVHKESQNPGRDLVGFLVQSPAQGKSPYCIPDKDLYILLLPQPAN